jgi:hypothetical protein
MLRIATQHSDEGIDDEAHDQENFPKGKPEFGLAIPFYGKNIDTSVRDRRSVINVVRGGACGFSRLRFRRGEKYP